MKNRKIDSETIKRIIQLAKEYGATRLILFGSYLETPDTAGDLDLACDGIAGWKTLRICRPLGKLSQEEEMKCIICYGEDVQITKTQEELRIGNNIVYVSIDIPVCRTCGERYYDRQSLRYLEEVSQKLKDKKVKLKEVGKILAYR
jgi:YgiT-type zinc finger domain-containing protein